MKMSLYFNYTSRSLWRGGQRTLLAVFCVAIGVMAVVSLQLAGYMLQSALTGSVRDTNGGDISVAAPSVPLNARDLSFFAQQKSAGTITNYTAITNANAVLGASTSSLQAFSVAAVDPQVYPLASQPTFVSPSNGSIASLLTGKQVIVTQNFSDKYHKQVGNSFDMYISTVTGIRKTIHVQVAGIVANAGIFAQASNLVLLAGQSYEAAAPAGGVTYGTVDIDTADQAHTDTAVKAIRKQFPLTSTQTVADAQKTIQASLTNINEFLQIAGLLALLIGGVGIINTMQVLLSRRKTEIAMLKTAGYKRMDLYLLFGLEASLLGLAGGVIGGAASIGVSYIVRNLMQSLSLNVPFVLNPWMLVGGLLIGLATTLIFGLMPIVQAATIRPLQVIRPTSEPRGIGRIISSVGLLALLTVLFCGFAIVIMNNNVLLGIEAVYGTCAFLLVPGLFLGLVMYIVSKLPVPEHFDLKNLSMIVVGCVVAVLAYLLMPIFGIIVGLIPLLGCIVVVMPRTWKVSTKVALRSIGRQRTRVTTTVVALFLGVFTIGIVLGLGLSLQNMVRDLFTQKGNYNIFVTTSASDTAHFQARVGSLPGMLKMRHDTMTQAVPVMLNGQPVQQVLPTDSNRQQVIGELSLLEGYDLSQAAPAVTMVHGRNLQSSDPGSNNIIVSDQLTSAGQVEMNFKVGDKLTMMPTDGKQARILTVVGIYSSRSMIDHQADLFGAAELVKALSPAQTGVSTVTYLKVDAAQVNNALDKLGIIVPNATVQNLADQGASFVQQLSSVIDMLAALASLSVIASVIIIANAVALSMLERRRELGILKAVGYTSRTVLGEVMVEYGVLGGIGALIATLLVAVSVSLLGSQLFNITINLAPWIVVVLIAGAMLLAMLTAALVAWSAVRVRPLEVLRYE